MQDLIQETIRGIAIPPDTHGAKHTVDWVNMEGAAKITFVIAVGGTATAGTLLKVQAATSKSGSNAADIAQPFDGRAYYKAAATTVPTLTSATSSTSVDYITIGTSVTTTYTATVDASALPAAKPYVALVGKDSSASSLDMGAVFFMWGTRYQQEAVLNALA
jgi:hypothetical protein